MTVAWNADLARAVLEPYRPLRGALLPMLHGLQEKFGYIDEAAVPLLAGLLTLSQAEVHGVISFYHEFRRTRPGRHVIRLCVAEACQARGADTLLTFLQQRLGIAAGETTADGGFTLETVYCLGNCALGPSAMIDEQLQGRLGPASFDGVLS